MGAHAELFAQVQPHASERCYQNLPKLFREGRTRHVADSRTKVILTTVVESDVMDVRLGGPDSQPDLDSNVPADPDATSGSTRSETHADSEAEVSTSIGTDMEIKALL